MPGANNTAFSPAVQDAIKTVSAARSAQRKVFKSSLGAEYNSTTSELFLMCLTIRDLLESIGGLDKESYIKTHLKKFDDETKKMKLAVISDAGRLDAIINSISTEMPEKKVVIKGTGTRNDDRTDA